MDAGVVSFDQTAQESTECAPVKSEVEKSK
jgi:hypothetical protein